MNYPVALLTLLLGVLSALAGCASGPAMQAPDDLFRDAWFEPARVDIDPAAPLALSPAMRDYLAQLSPAWAAPSDPRHRLLEVLRRGDLKIDYDAATTRTAAQAFDAREGNCLALVLMTAALARHLGLDVHYQSVLGEDVWDRAGDLFISVGHVNLRLEERLDPRASVWNRSGETVIDFLAPVDAERLPTRQIAERTVVAMYMNNRAVESLTQGHVDDAYWWTRAALRQDRGLLSAYVTLGVVYQQRHHPELSEAVLERVAQRAPDDVVAMSNRIVALRELGRRAEADALSARLRELDPEPPYSYFQRGMDALRDGKPEVARRFFTREVERAPYHAEFEYWLAVSYAQLNDAERAAQHLQRAVEGSSTRSDRQLYSAKLERLKAHRMQ
ncbi:MAG: tetratricopeptide repeat protein [Pseudomonadota bacterium]|nr:tetratricopeptide repeat protein [Pseudomonadota bacterium]